MSKLRSQLSSLSSQAPSQNGQANVRQTDNYPDAQANLGQQGGDLPSQNHHQGGRTSAESQKSSINMQELSDIKATLQNLTQQLAVREPEPNPPASVPDNREPIDTAALAGTLSRSLRDNLREQMATEIDKMRAELGSLQQGADAANDKAVLEDIQRISEGIHELQSRQVISADQFGEMAGELRGMHREVRSLSERPATQIDSGEITRSIQSSYEEIAKRLDGIGTSQSGNQFEALSEKLEGIKGNLATTDPQSLVRIESQLHELNTGILALGDLHSAGSDNAIDVELPKYFEGLDRRMDEITRAVVASTSPEPAINGEAAFDRIEARIASLAKSVETISQGNNNSEDHPQMAQLYQLPVQVQASLAGLEERISQISTASGNSDAGIFEEFGGQLASLTQKIDSLQNAPATQANMDGYISADSSEIGVKLDQLATTLERAINSGDGSVGQLESQIAELSNRIDNAANFDKSEQQNREGNETRVFEELQSLAARVETLDSSFANAAPQGEQFNALEEQIVAIAAQLNSVGGQPDMSAIETRLGGIEEQFAANRDVAIEAVNQALQQAGPNNDGAEQISAISALAEDLQNLTRTSNELKGHSLETFDAVRDSLAMILDRINSIEVRIANEESGETTPQNDERHEDLHSAEMVDAAREYASSLSEQHAVARPFMADKVKEGAEHYSENILPDQEQTNIEIPTNEMANTAELPQVDAPSLDLQHMPPPENSAASPVIDGDDLPLEPGSGAPELIEDEPHGDGPNMDALMRQAKENRRKDTLEDEQQNPTDFIAAARRAAQAAANDENTRMAQIAPKPGKLLAFKNVLQRRKKPLMMGVAALAIAAFAMPAYNYYSSLQSAPMAETMQTEPQDTDKLSDAGDNKSSDVEMANSSSEKNLDLSTPSANNEMQAMPKMVMPDKMKPDAADQSMENKATSTVRSLNEEMAKPAVLTKAPLPPKEVGPIALRQAAAAGNAKAQFEVGRRYTNGINGKPDLEEAVVWYKLAANAKYAPAQYRLGNFYEKGHGVDSDVNAAASWYKQSAEQGNALAMHNLAVINAMGVLEGGANMREASTWFEKAAEHGVKDSQVNLGIVYAKAMGVDVDLEQAYKWFAIAAKAGDKDAAQKRDTVAKQMRPDQLEQARGTVELWKPKELNVSANTVDIPAEWNIIPQTTASLSTTQLVQKTQSALASLGFQPGVADGVMGAKTIKAIKEFQARAGIAVNGKVTPDLVTALEKSVK